jgi:hypothetical protein
MQRYAAEHDSEATSKEAMRRQQYLIRKVRQITKFYNALPIPRTLKGEITFIPSRSSRAFLWTVAVLWGPTGMGMSLTGAVHMHWLTFCLGLIIVTSAWLAFWYLLICRDLAIVSPFLPKARYTDLG